VTMTIKLRLSKGSKLSHIELDSNFVELDNRVSALESATPGGGGEHYVMADIADPLQLNGVLTTTNIIENGVVSSELVTSYALVGGSTYKFYLEGCH